MRAVGPSRGYLRLPRRGVGSFGSRTQHSICWCPAQAGTWGIKVNVKKITQGKTRDEYDFESYTATLTLEVFP